MSFLLQHSKRNKSNNDSRRGFAQTATLGERVLPPAKPAASRGGRSQTVQQSSHSSSGSNAYQGQQQEQLFRQRPPSYAAPSQKQSSQQQRYPATPQQQQQQLSRKQQANEEKQKQHLAVSMAEVMEDLQILEQQQREAQRQLASARLTKEHRLQQQLGLENQLGVLKYSNGEMRAQISQARDLLAAASREFGARRLASNRAADRIRAFDHKLRKGLLSARMISEKRRKIESLLTVGRNKQSIVRRLLEEANDKLGVLKKQNIDAKQHEESLRKSIQKETSASQEHITATAILRSKNKMLEQELITAQTAGESTKLEADAVEDEVQREKQRHEEAVAALKMKLQSRMRVNDDLSKQAESAKQDLDEKTELLHSAWTRCIEYQKEERHEICPPPTDPQAVPPAFDMARLRRSVEDEDCILRNHQSGRQQLQGNVDKLRAELDHLQGETRTNLEKALSILEVALQEQKNEEERRLHMTECLNEVENARTEVADLLNRCKQREEDMIRRASSHSQQVLEHKEAITRDREAIARDKSHLETEKAAAEDLLASWEREKSTIQEKLVDAKKRAEDSKNALVKLKAEVTSLANTSPNVSTREEENCINEEGIVACEETEEEISRLLQNYPELSNVSFSYDPEKSYEEQADGDLNALVEACQARVVAARRQRQQLDQQREELRRQAEATAAAVKRKEEDRRNQEERHKAKILQREREKRLEAETQARQAAEKHAEAESAKAKREEDERQRELLDKGRGVREDTKKIDAPNGRGPTRQARGRSKSSEFYLPQTQEANVEETPARPQTLLAAFTHAEEYVSPDDPPAFSSSQDKRVHWKDASSERQGKQEVDKQQTLNPNAMQERTLPAIKPSGNSKAFVGKENEKPAPDQKPTALAGRLEQLAVAPQGNNEAYQISHEGMASKGVDVAHGDRVPERLRVHTQKRSSKSPQRDHSQSKRGSNRTRSPRRDKLSTAKNPPLDEEVALKVDSNRPSSLMTAFPSSQTIPAGTLGDSSSHGLSMKKRVYGSTTTGGRAGLSTSGTASVASGRSASSKSTARSFKMIQTTEKNPELAPLVHGRHPTVGEGTKGSQRSRKHDVVSGISSSQSDSRSIKDYAHTHKADTIHDGQSGLVEGFKSTYKRPKDPATVENSWKATSRNQNQTDSAPDHFVQKDVLGNADGRKSTHRSSTDSIFSVRSTSKHASQSMQDASKRADTSPPLMKVQGELVDAERQKLSYKSRNDFATSRRASSKSDSQALSDVTNTKKGAALSKKVQGDDSQVSTEVLKMEHKSGDTSIISGRTPSNPDSRPSKGGSKHDPKPTQSKLEREIGFRKGDAKSPHRKSGNASVASGRSHSSKSSSRPKKATLGTDKATVPAKQPRNSDATSGEGRKSQNKSSNTSIASGRSTSSKSKGTSSSEARKAKKSIHDDASTAVSKSSLVSGQSRKRSHSNEASAHPSKVRSRKKNAVAAVRKVSSKSFTADNKYDFSLFE